MSAGEDALITNVSALIREGKFDAAQPLLLRALQRSPGHARLNSLAAQVFLRQGLKDRALYYAERACKSSAGVPGEQAASLWVFGDVQVACANVREGVESFERAASLDPQALAVRRRLVQKLGEIGWMTRAVAHARAALALAPRNANSFNLLMNTLMASGDVRGAMHEAEELLKDQPEYLHAAITAAAARNYIDGATREEVFAAHTRVGRLLGQRAAPAGHGASPRGDRRPLRIGIVSAEFREHSVSYFIEPIMRHLDRGAFTLLCYSVGEREDARTNELRGLADHWRACAALDPAALASAIRTDAVDILIETSGLTGGNRLEALASRPAPVQVTYCGYPNTTGLKAIDYRIVDSLTDPAGEERWCTETLVRLDPCFLCYTPSANSPAVSPAPFEAAGGVTFGSFNTLLKVTDRVMETWVRIAAATPGGRLMLKGQQLADPEIIERLHTRAESAGLARDRLVLVDFTRTPEEHLALYSKVDIALDPFPYNGTTTICEAAWMGVPTVTLAGAAHAGRVGSSLLNAMGLSELIARDEDEYTAKAVGLAADRARLREIRSTLRERVRSSVLCDAVAFCRRFEAALQHMWRETNATR